MLVCLECSGIHRGLGVQTSKVRSLTLDKVDDSTVALMKALGNSFANSVRCSPFTVYLMCHSPVKTVNGKARKSHARQDSPSTSSARAVSMTSRLTHFFELRLTRFTQIYEAKPPPSCAEGETALTKPTPHDDRRLSTASPCPDAASWSDCHHAVSISHAAWRFVYLQHQLAAACISFHQLAAEDKGARYHYNETLSGEHGSRR